MMEQIQILRGMKERLFEKGWQKGNFGGVNGPNCILGALALVPAVDWWDQDRVAFLLGRECGLISAAYFNDDVGTTFDDIVDLIDKVIKRLEGEAV